VFVVMVSFLAIPLRPSSAYARGASVQVALHLLAHKPITEVFDGRLSLVQYLNSRSSLIVV
jgi:hypothetical protein